jgi:hypothetical protein
MTDTPSLALLKGQEDMGKDDPIDAVEDIKLASAKALEVLLADNDTPIPEGWGGMSIEQKRAWVLAKFEENGAEQQPASAPAAEAPAAAPAKTKAKGKKAKGDATVTAPADPELAAALEKTPAEQPQSVETKAEDPPFAADPPKEAAPAEQPAEEPKKGKLKKAKGTEIALAPKEGEIIEPDLIKDIVHEVENMEKKTALELVVELNEQADISFFRLGGILSLVSANGWWQNEEKQYKTFREYIEKEHGLEYRKATYWIAIYNALAKSDVPWKKVKEVGWTKLKEIAKVLTVENVDEWVDKAKQVNTLTLQDMVKKETSGSDDAGAPAETEKVTTKTFKVHSGQKEVIETAIKKAKEASGTEVDTVALEFICQDYLGGSGAADASKTPAQKLAQQLKGMDIEVVMHIVDESFPDFDFTVDKKEEAAASAA